MVQELLLYKSLLGKGWQPGFLQDGRAPATRADRGFLLYALGVAPSQ